MNLQEAYENCPNSSARSILTSYVKKFYKMPSDFFRVKLEKMFGLDIDHSDKDWGIGPNDGREDNWVDANPELYE